MKLLALLCIVAAAVAASTALAAPPDVTDLRSCSTRGDSDRPQQLPPTPGVAIGPLVIWPSVRTHVGATGQHPWAYEVKAPIVLPARTKVTLAVAQRALGQVEFQSQSAPNTWVTAVRFEACPENVVSFTGTYRVGKYTGFPFGFRLTRKSACIPMEVWIDGSNTPIRRLVPVGRRSCG